MRGLVDTSVFIALESGRRIERGSLPEEAAISVVTLAELQAGVLAAADVQTRAKRLTTVNRLSHVELLGVDAGAANTWALMCAHLEESGRRINVNDLWIAATAASRGLPVVTQDDDFGPVEGIAGLQVVRV